VTSHEDERDKRTDQIHELLVNPDVNPEWVPLEQALYRDQLAGQPPGGWPEPTTASRERAYRECWRAAVAARVAIATLGRTLNTGLPKLGNMTVSWRPRRPEEGVQPAPLVHCLLDEGALFLKRELTAFAYTPGTRILFEGDEDDVWRALLCRLNGFAYVEASLWWYASEGGYPHLPPYAVRYDLANWLWHPSLSGDSIIFWLRCGREALYHRRERQRTDGEHARNARCRACTRGRPDDWPKHALEPYERGTWLLHCSHPGCNNRFVGRRQAQRCPRHRLNRITLGARRPTV
jgi:hypothetical protein